MNRASTRILAVVEVILVVASVLGLSRAVSQTPLKAWQEEHVHYLFHGHLLFALLPVLWLLLTRRSLVVYGLTLAHWRDDVAAALSCVFPIALAGASLGFLPYTRWDGALIESAVQVGLLFWVAYLLTRQPDPKSGIITIALALLMFGGYSYWKGLYPGTAKGIASFIYYLVFVGFGEEILYRGYVLTRLNEAFGRPWQFYGVGWGTVLASFLFGLTHALSKVDLASGQIEFTWAWGLWTFFGGFVFSYIREKTGSIVAPAIVHGLPQALVYLLIRAP